MTCTLDFSTAAADVLAAGLDTITFASLTAGDALRLTTTVYDGDTSTVLDTWATTYYADEQGKVTIRSLASLWRSYILFRRRRDDAGATQPAALPGGIKVGFTYLMADGTTTATCTRRIWYTRHDILTATIGGMNDKVPFISKQKRTFADAVERIYVIGSSSRTIKAVATYVSGSTQGTSTHTLSTNVSSDSFARSTDVSPSRIQSLLSTGASLREYTIQVCSGSTVLDSCRYIVEQDHYAQRMQVAWLNRWGIYETLWLVGSEQLSTERKADYGYSGDLYTALDVEVEESFQQSTGLGPRSMVDQVRDIASSPDVWRYDHANSRWQRITVIGVDIKRTTPTNQAHACTVTYRPARRF